MLQFIEPEYPEIPESTLTNENNFFPLILSSLRPPDLHHISINSYNISTIQNGTPTLKPSREFM